MTISRPAFLRTAILTAVIASAFWFSSCSDSPTGPGGGDGVATKGRISFMLDGTSMRYEGTAAWPPVGSGVLAAMDSAGRTLQIAGYEQVSAGKSAGAGPEPAFNFIVFEIYDTAGISAGSYPLSFSMAVGTNISMSDLDSLAYVAASGMLKLTSVTPERITGSFSATCLRLSDFSSVTVSGGVVDAPYVRGLFDLEDTSDAGGDFSVSVGTGTQPVYTWSGGPVNALTVFRDGEQPAPVWAIVTYGADSIASGITHGQVPPGAMAVTSAETDLTQGVAYRIVVSRTDGDHAYRRFTP